MEYTNEKDNKLKSVIVGILYVIFGIIVVMNPMTTLLSISLIIGWGMLVVGAVLVLNGIRLRAFPQISTMNTIEGILLLLLGVMFLFTDFIKSTQILAYLMMLRIITDAAKITITVRINDSYRMGTLCCYYCGCHRDCLCRFNVIQSIEQLRASWFSCLDLDLLFKV
ncbi:DUF308 domain-containing protein [Erysipelothrix sp. D19-032]